MSVDRILAERRRKARMAADPEYATRFKPVTKVTPIATPGAAATPPVPFSATRAGLAFAHQQQLKRLGIQRRQQEALARKQHAQALARQRQEQVFARQEAERRRAEAKRIRLAELKRVREENINRLRAEREGTFVSLMKSGDQARAVMFALGYGPESDVFDVQARALGTTVQELKGARALQTTTQEALSRVLRRRVTIGREGVRGLGTAIGAARAYVQGGTDIQTMLQSAFGVGSLRRGERPGMSAERLAGLTQQVTPRGVLM